MKSIQARLTITFIGLMVALLVTVWGVNRWYLEDFYVNQKVESLMRAYDTIDRQIERYEKGLMCKEQLLQRLEALVGEEGEVRAVKTSARVDGDLLKVTLESECLEEIGREAPGRTPMPQQADSGA